MRKLWSIIAISSVILIGGLVAHSPKARAVSAADWKPGRIIDDVVFQNKSSMTVGQIQQFLNGKMPACDTKGTQSSSYTYNPVTKKVNAYNAPDPNDQWVTTTRALYTYRTHLYNKFYKQANDKYAGSPPADSTYYNPPTTYAPTLANPRPAGVPDADDPWYTTNTFMICLKDYYQNPTTLQSNYGSGVIPVGAKSAAQLIWDASQAQNINPQVFLVLLQKEQSLITDDWPWAVQYDKATGNNCPDTAPCDPTYAGFWVQVNNAGVLFNYYVTHFDEYNYAPGWNNILYQANNPGCGTRSVFIENAFTAALYIYTPYTPNQAALDNMYGEGDSCSAYGNRNFWRMFNDWFGGTLANSTNCDSRVSGTVCVWSLKKADGSQFLTTSKSELTGAISAYGWVNEGIVFYASQSQQQSTVPVYRLRLNGKHYYTSDQAEFDAKKTGSEGWTDEGIAFNAYPTTTPINASHRVYKLYKSTTDQYYLTINASRKNSLLSAGYVLQPESFNTFSGLVALPLPPTDRYNAYVLRNGTRTLLTSSVPELESAIKLKYTYERVLTTFKTDATGVPVYRLQTQNGYFYTTNANERLIASQNYGMSDEGIVFYLDEGSNTIYRSSNTLSNRYHYTDNLSEVMQLTNTAGWRYEGTLYNKLGSYPVLRFLNTTNGKHFYTINVYEAAKITNTNWKYEGVAFYASRTTDDPIYRLRLDDKYFFTNNVNEKDSAISRYGYRYEGIAFYVSVIATSDQVFRLQGSNDEYFYTRSPAERDLAVSKYGYRFEGLGFYAMSP